MDDVRASYRALGAAVPPARRPYRVVPPSLSPSDHSAGERPAPPSQEPTARVGRTPPSGPPPPQRRRGRVATSLLIVGLAAGALVYVLRPAPSVPVPAPAPPPAASAETVVVDVADPPPGLAIAVDGRPASLPLELPRDGRMHRLELRAPGMPPITRQVEGTRSQVITLPPPAPPAESPPPPPAAAEAPRKKSGSPKASKRASGRRRAGGDPDPITDI
jgi:hypothetical protein